MESKGRSLLIDSAWRSQWMRPKLGFCAVLRAKVRTAARKRKQERGW